MNNSFRISYNGPRTGAAAEVVKCMAFPETSDQTQAEAAKSAVLATVKALPDKFNAVNILAYGEWGPTGGEARFHVSGSVAEVVEVENPAPVELFAHASPELEPTQTK